MQEPGAGPWLQELEAAARAQPPRAYEHEPMTANKAQRHVNFVIVIPPQRRGGSELQECVGTLRREAAPPVRHDVGGHLWPGWNRLSPCSFRFEWPLEDANGHLTRTVRVKQVLPDFPMLLPLGPIHPTAYKAPITGQASELGNTSQRPKATAPRPSRASAFTLPGSRAGWIGMNAAGNRAAVFISHGTLVEVAEIAGNLETEEMTAFCASLQPVSTEAVRAVESTPLAHLSYHTRHTGTSGFAEHVHRKIASSLFRIRWPIENSGASRWTDDMSVAERWFGWPPGGGAFGRGARVLNLLREFRWRPDSVCVVSSDDEPALHSVGGRQEKPAEVMLLCYPADGPRHQVLWLRRIRRWSGCPLTPRDGNSSNENFNWDDGCIDELRPVTTSWVNALGCGDLRVAWVSDRHGPFEALAWGSDHLFLLQVSPKSCNGNIQSHDFQQMARRLAQTMLG